MNNDDSGQRTINLSGTLTQKNAQIKTFEPKKGSTQWGGRRGRGKNGIQSNKSAKTMTRKLGNENDVGVGTEGTRSKQTADNNNNGLRVGLGSQPDGHKRRMMRCRLPMSAAAALLVYYGHIITQKHTHTHTHTHTQVGRRFTGT